MACRRGWALWWARTCGWACRCTTGGEIQLSGVGLGVSGTWSRQDYYLDAQVELTYWEVDLESEVRGRLRDEVSGQGHAVALEAGKRMAVALGGAGEWAVTPRLWLAHASVSMSDF